MNCTKDNIPSFSQDNSKLCIIFDHFCPNSKNFREKPGIPHYSICRKNNNYIIAAIKCTQCQHLIHKMCLKCRGNASKDYKCSECIAENIPFSKLESNDIIELCFLFV